MHPPMHDRALFCSPLSASMVVHLWVVLGCPCGYRLSPYSSVPLGVVASGSSNLSARGGESPTSATSSTSSVACRRRSRVCSLATASISLLMQLQPRVVRGTPSSAGADSSAEGALFRAPASSRVLAPASSASVTTVPPLVTPRGRSVTVAGRHHVRQQQPPRLAQAVRVRVQVRVQPRRLVQVVPVPVPVLVRVRVAQLPPALPPPCRPGGEPAR